jgi:hypothetical protein
LAFFTAATLCLLGGMIWGTIMGATGDFLLAPAHAHLNLVGWASLALMGIFHALRGAPGKLAWVNFFLSTAGVAIMIPSLAVYLAGDKGAHVGVAIGSVVAVLGMLTFLVAVLSAWGKPKTVAA